jgi:uncharacterized repeat protein (TIGR01451 family)
MGGAVVVGAAVVLAFLPTPVSAAERGDPDGSNTVCVIINTTAGEHVVPGSNCPPPAPPSPPSTGSSPASAPVAGAPSAPTTADPTVGVAALPIAPPPGSPPTAPTTGGPPSVPAPVLPLPPGALPLPTTSPPTRPIDTTTTSTTSTTPTTSTTSTTSPRRPPVTAPAPMPRLSVTASWSPQRPTPGQMATVTIVVRNDGTAAVDDLVLADEVGSSTHLRSASSDDGACTIEGRRARCELGRLASWSEATVRVRVLVDPEPAGQTLVNRISLSAGGHMSVEEQTVSALIAPGPTEQMGVLGLPGSTVTLIVLVSFALAARQARPSTR